MRDPDFEKPFRAIIDTKGGECLPNVEEVTDRKEALRLISRADEMFVPYQMRLRNFDPPLNGVQTHEHVWYPKIFKNTDGMGGRFDGSGVILTATGYNGTVGVFKFHFCKHDWDKSGANPFRGWHPRVCKKCGFDASVDSGD